MLDRFNPLHHTADRCYMPEGEICKSTSASAYSAAVCEPHGAYVLQLQWQKFLQPALPLSTLRCTGNKQDHSLQVWRHAVSDEGAV